MFAAVESTSECEIKEIPFLTRICSRALGCFVPLFYRDEATPPVSSRCGRLLPSFSTDACSFDAVIASKVDEVAVVIKDGIAAVVVTETARCTVMSTGKS